MAAGDEYFTDLLKISFLYTGERNTAQNILYASCLGAHGATLAALNSVATSIGSLWSSAVMPYVTEQVTFETVEVADWTDAEGLTGSDSPGTAGSLTGDKMTDQVSVLVNEQTNLRYRGGRGRIYLPQPDITKVETGTTWNSTFVSDYTSSLADCLTDINELTIGDDLLTLVLYHRGSKDVEQGVEPILAVEVSVTPGTQRRRVRRVGHLR